MGIVSARLRFFPCPLLLSPPGVPALDEGRPARGLPALDEAALSTLVYKHFDLTPRGIIEALDLLRPIYRATSYHGHFGREDSGFPWERTDRAEALGRDAAR